MSLVADFQVARDAFTLAARFAVRRGEVLAVLGPNGSGKSTLLSVLSGLLRPDEGQVSLAGRNWVDTGNTIFVPAHRRRAGLLAQNSLLFPHLSALDNVAFGPRAAGVNRSRARAVALEWLSKVDCSDLARRKPGQLSGGQAQRVALARALAAAPDALLLDEPLAALDVDAAPAMRGLLHRVLQQQETPTVLVTHDVLDAVVLADRVLVLAEGSVVEQGRTREVLARPKAAFTARIAGLNFVVGVASDGGIAVRGTDGGTDGGIAVSGTVITGSVAEPVRPGESAAAVFTPASVAVHRHLPHGSPRNAVRVRVSALEPRGDTIRVKASGLDTGLAADITPAAVAELALAAGDEVWFVMKATEVAIHPVSGGPSGSE